MDEMRFTVDAKADIEEIKEEEKKKKFDFAKMDVISMFENIIKKNQFIKTRDFGNGLTVTLRPLNVGELIEAEAIIRKSNPHIPIDTMVKLRSAAILSKAIMQIGDKSIENTSSTDEENQIRRFTLYSQLIQMPPVLITEIYKFYLSVVEEEDAFFHSPADIDGKIEDFSTAPSEQ